MNILYHKKYLQEILSRYVILTYMQKTLILVLSTGRSRSHSFAYWLDMFPEITMLHEGGSAHPLGFFWYRIKKFILSPFRGDHIFTWTQDTDYKMKHLEKLLEQSSTPWCGDTGMFYFGYDTQEDVLASIVNYFEKKYTVKIIFLTRPKDEVVRSFLDRSLDLREENPYRYIPFVTAFTLMCRKNFPVVLASSPQSALEQYHDDFTERMYRYHNEHPESSLIIDSKKLDTSEARKDILDFLGIIGNNHHIPFPKVNTKNNLLNIIARYTVKDSSEWPPLHQ